MADANYKVVVDFQVKGQKQMTEEMDKHRKTTKTVNQEMSVLRNNLLSVMFAAYGVNRLFGGQIQRMQELTGQTDMFDAFWTVTMIKPMSTISGILADLLKDFLELPSSVQSGIGWGVTILEGGAKVVEFLSGLGLALIGLRGLVDGKTGIKAALTGLGGAGTTAGTEMATGLSTGLGSLGAVLKGGAWVIGLTIAALIAKSFWDDIKKANEEIDALVRKRNAYGNSVVSSGTYPTYSQRLEAGQVGRESVQSQQPIRGIPVGNGGQQITPEELSEGLNAYIWRQNFNSTFYGNSNTYVYLVTE